MKLHQDPRRVRMLSDQRKYHSFLVILDHDHRSTLDTMRAWCLFNLSGLWHSDEMFLEAQNTYSGRFYVHDDDDALMFKLRFG